jgi:hypothetical protein
MYIKKPTGNGPAAVSTKETADVIIEKNRRN